MLGPILGRSEQGEQKIHRAIVDGVIGDRRIQAHEDGRNPIDLLQPGVRHGDARPKAGRAQGFTLQQGFEHASLIHAHGLGRRLSDRVQCLPLGRSAAAQHYAVGRQEVCDMHCSRLQTGEWLSRAPL